MTQVQFTLETKEIQSLIENAVKDDLAKNILLTVFRQIMEQQRTEYLQVGDYDRELTTRIGTLELKVPRTRDGKVFS